MFTPMNQLPKDVESFHKEYGSDHTLPPNFEEITEAEFSQSKFFVYTPNFCEYRQITKKEDYERFTWGESKRSYSFSLRLFYFYDGTGVAMAHDYWAKKVRYFKFAKCHHKNKSQRNVGNCLNEYTCGDCGFKETIDSSD